MREIARTTCGCKECVKCCKQQPGCLGIGDLEKIAAFLGKTIEQAMAFFWASPGALLMDRLTGRVYRVGTITPRYDKRLKRCVFLTDDDRCSIHEVAPFGCAYFDTHMDNAEADKRSRMAIREQQTDEYQELRSKLPFGDHYNPRRVT